MQTRRLPVVVAAAVVVLALVGCAPHAGIVRAEHPLLGDESGRPALAPASGFMVFDDPVPSDDNATGEVRSRIAKLAGEAVGKGAVVVNGARYRMDCSGVASGIYARAGFDLGARSGGLDVHTLFELVRRTGSLRRAHPLPGDFAFFDDTYDANGNGLRDDPLSHIAIVERVEDDGTVLLVHRVGSSVVRARMNLDEPHARHDGKGRVLNHYLRLAEGALPAKTTAELFIAYGSLPLRDAPRVASR